MRLNQVISMDIYMQLNQGILDDLYFCILEVQLTFPTYEQIVKDLSLVESENLLPNVIVALGSLFEKETSLWGYEEDEDLKQLIAFVANLCEVGVVQSIKYSPMFQYEDRSENLFLKILMFLKNMDVNCI